MSLAALALLLTYLAAPQASRPVYDGGAPRLADAQSAADTSGHRSATITRDGVRLHYLDWGGTGPAVVLLPGYGLTGHAFDDIAGILVRDFRVLAITPRGVGQSAAPPDSAAYTIATMTEDLRAVLDSLGISRAALVGHSMSGSTIGVFARKHPERVTRLVFLDAFPYWAAAGGDSVDALSPVTSHGFTGDMTYPRVREFLRRYRFSGWSAALESDLRANTLGDELRRRQRLTAGYIRDQRSNPVDLAGVAAPALQICTIPSVSSEYPWLRSGTREHVRAAAYVETTLRPFSRALCDQFRSALPGSQTADVDGSHYVFFTRPALAARAIRRFLLE